MDDSRRRGLIVLGMLVLGTLAVQGAAQLRSWSALPQPSTAAARARPVGHGRGVHVEARFDRSAVLQGGDGRVHAELVLAADAAPPGTPSLDGDVLVLLDHSGSMSGEKLERARQAVLDLVGRLGERDRFGLIAYASDARLAFPLTAMTPEARARALALVRGIEVAGGTNISAALELAAQTLGGARSPDRVTRALLLSDGHPTEGDTTPEGLLQRASAARRQDFVLTALGIGADFNEELMAGLADAGTGNFYYMEHGDMMAQVFAGEFEATRATLARSLHVDLALGPGVALLDAGGYPLERHGDGVRFWPGTLFASQRRSIWLTFQLPTDRPRELALGKLEVGFERDGAPQRLALTGVPGFRCVQDEAVFAASIDRAVWARAVAQSELARLQQQVARAVREGRQDQVAQEISAAQARLGGLNHYVQSAEVSRDLESLDSMRGQASAAFAAPDAAGERKLFAKRNQAAALKKQRSGAYHWSSKY